MLLKTNEFYNFMAPFYDTFMEAGESTLEDELKLILKTFPQSCRILDVGCGTGRIAFSLQEKGYDITGLDISQGMINEAIKKGFKKGYVEDLTYFKSTQKSFDGIISLHTGFSYVNDEKIIRQMINICKHLLIDGGIILWDTPNEEFYGKERILEWPAGKRIVKTICYGYNLTRLRVLFVNEGFKIREIWGSYTPLQKFKKNLPRIIIEAEK